MGMSTRKFRRATAVVPAALAMLAGTLASNLPANATAFPGINGKLACWSGSQPTHILTMNQDGSDQRDISAPSPFSDFDPVWTADGRQIVVATGRIGSFSELGIMNADGSNFQPLVVNGSPDDRVRAPIRTGPSSWSRATVTGTSRSTRWTPTAPTRCG